MKEIGPFLIPLRNAESLCFHMTAGQSFKNGFVMQHRWKWIVEDVQKAEDPLPTENTFHLSLSWPLPDNNTFD
jgi:hypothetical protein